jgi:DNA polymerase I-like protein with 3'-5' exonuclease and polymerase domains
MAINMPIQGTAADIVKIAMIRLARRLQEDGFRARILLQVHDDLLLDVPLTVDVKLGDDWESMTPVSRRDAVLAEAGEAPVETAR